MNHRSISSLFMRGLLLFGLLAVLGFKPSTTTQAAEDQSNPPRYNVTFDSPSKGAIDSMPMGNGEVALNAWFEEEENLPNPDLFILLARTDSWGDNSRHLKIGRLRISVVPVQKTGATANDTLKDFNQTLHLEDSTIRASWGKGNDRVSLQLWIDANRPVVQLNVESVAPSEVLVKNEVWRDKRRTLNPERLTLSDVMFDYKKRKEGHAPTILEPDTIITDLPSGMIGWCHHNFKSVGPRDHARIQGVADFKRPDPLLHRTFGAIVAAKNAKRVNEKELLLSEDRQHDLSVYVRAEYPSTIAKWRANTLTQMKKDRQALQGNPKAFRAAHEKWWRNFWRRSWINITQAGDISRAYTLQRYVIACAGRGDYPIKFNGTLFCVGTPDDPDYRNCGPGYWWQNTRFPYYTMCPSGDFEMMKPLFKMYVTDLFEFWKHRTRRHTGHDGIYIPECIHFWGDCFNEAYGWTPFEQRGEDKLQESPCHKYEWVSTPELVYLALNLYDYTLDRKVLDEIAVPLAEETFKFFSQHYKRNESGKLVMYPSQALETWRGETANPMSEIAGLHSITKRLLALDKKLTTPQQRARWKTMQKMIPPMPLREIDGVTMLAPAGKWDDHQNNESPELYAIFPFRLITAANDPEGWGKAAFDARGHKNHYTSWNQHSINAAYLGLTDDASSLLKRRYRGGGRNRRFPVWYVCSVNEVPDQDNGGAMVITLQSMLMQVDGKKIYLLPAWPKNWSVDFRLHAPGKTVIDCRYQDGKIQRLSVTPKSRRKDIIIVPQKDALVGPSRRRWSRAATCFGHIAVTSPDARSEPVDGPSVPANSVLGDRCDLPGLRTAGVLHSRPCPRVDDGLQRRDGSFREVI